MFIVSLLVAVGSVSIYEKLEAISEEGAIACVAVALISMALALVSAPWQFHLLLVLAIIIFRTQPIERLPMGERFDWVVRQFGLTSGLSNPESDASSSN